MRTTVLSLVFVCSLAACNGSASAKSASSEPQKVQSFSDISQAIAQERVSFDVRGLANKGQVQAYGGTSYFHTATIVAKGDSTLVNLPYYVLYTVKRVSGGDPSTPRLPSAVETAYVHDGVGDLSIAGGYRTTSEKWDPEVIELTQVGVIPVVVTKPKVVREQ